MQINDNYCAMLYNHVAIKPTGEISPCCRFNVAYIIDKNLHNTSLQDIFNCDEYNVLREKINGTDRYNGCRACTVEEEAGVESLRCRYNKRFTMSDEPTIEFLEVALSNKCNLKCRSCGSKLSSNWYDDEIGLQNILKDECKFFDRYSIDNERIVSINEKNIDDSILNDLKILKIVGGEPLIEPQLKQLLMRMSLSSRKNCKLELYTNCSTFPDDELLELILSFKDVIIFLSVDAYGQKNEYIRHGCKWKYTEQNIKQWLSISSDKVKPILASTITIYSLPSFTELAKWWNDISDNMQHMTVIAKHPIYISPLVLPQQVLNQVIEEIEPLCVDESWNLNDKLLRFLKCSHSLHQTHYNKFIQYNNALDEIRDESYDEFCKL